MPNGFWVAEIDGALYWDGAVVANTPLRPVLDEGAEDIYGVLLSPPGAREWPAPAHLHDASAYAFDLAGLASFEADQKQLEKVNRHRAGAYSVGTGFAARRARSASPHGLRR